MALSEFKGVAVSKQVDRRLATKVSIMDLPVDGVTVKLLRTDILHSLGNSRGLEDWEANFLLQATLVRYLRPSGLDMLKLLRTAIMHSLGNPSALEDWKATP